VADEEDPKRPLLPPQERLPVAHASTRVPALLHRASHYFRSLRLDGTWEKLNALFLRERVRVRGGRDPQPSAGILDTLDR
jgi:hypothetical protein